MTLSRRVAAFIGACALFLAVGRPVCAQTEVGPLPNFHAVDPGIYRGGAPTPEGLKKLKSMGVTTIIDLRGPSQANKEEPLAAALGFKWINLPMGAEAPTKKEVQTLLTTLNQATPQQAVFVHCQHGADRTGCMVGIWRERHDGWTFDQAFPEMRKYGFKTRWVQLSDTVRKYAKK